MIELEKKLWREREAEDLFHAVWGEHLNIVGLVSGYFHFSVHRGHVAMIRAAARLCDALIVVVNGEEATKKKYGFSLPVQDRMAVLGEFSSVSAVIDYDCSNMCGMLEILRPSFFLRGGDVSEKTMDKNEILTCEKFNIRILYGIGGENKMASNSDYIKMIRNTK